ncbi:hypothetical protein [Oryza sativa Japonica Group]|uniref:Uncharacterized protein n=1 Tax=Oryza sativa subsp. japonica TaxID=39947 RepID=Q5QN16_ORYSJ|nr:hypothetical protein [Oryza sativa Japonica Group]
MSPKDIRPNAARTGGGFYPRGQGHSYPTRLHPRPIAIPNREGMKRRQRRKNSFHKKIYYVPIER